MNIKVTIPVLLLFLFSLLACRLLIPERTATPPPAVAMPTMAGVTASPLVPDEPVETEAPESTLETGPSDMPEIGKLPLTEGTPVQAWKGIPVMPGAISGQDQGESYMFTTQASAEEVRAYYEKELKQQGWNPLGLGEGDTQNVLLLFQKGPDMITVAIIDLEDGKGVLQVVLLK